MTALLVAAAIASAVNAGIFFDFSTFAMQGLRALPPRQGLQAMQSMNVTAVRPPLMIAMFGTAVLTIVVAVLAFGDLGEDWAKWALAGTVVFVLSIVVLTGTFHVPRNDWLAEVDPDAANAAERWETYAREWTLGNHVRTVAPVFSAIAFLVAAFLR